MNPKSPILPLVLGLALSLPALAATAHPSRSKLTPCKVPGEDKEIDALCATYQVWEDRQAKTGRKLSLKVVVLPARAAEPLPDPVFFLAGGPGQTATRQAREYADHALRQERDFVFIDQRGTGEPDRLGCDFGQDAADVQNALGELFPLEAVERCREALAKRADLTLYTTAIAMDDVDEVRAWLGYPRINLDGTSYGSRAAQVYLRRHPATVRTAILRGPVPMDETAPLSHAEYGQKSLDLLLGWCEKDAACRGKFPDVRGDLEKVLARLDQGPVEVEVERPDRPAKVRLSREVLVDGIRQLLYNPRQSARLPLFLNRAAAGDFRLLGREAVSARVGVYKMLALGQLLSVTCSEDLPFLDQAQIGPRTAGSFLGDHRVRQQARACAAWPRGRVDPGHREPLRSDLPILVITGERDPVTPPEFARRVARHLPNALVVVIPYGSHSGNAVGCGGTIQDQLIRTGTTKGIDTSCLARVELPPFVLE